MCRSPISPAKGQAGRRSLQWTSTAFPGAPPNPAPARLLPETSENLPVTFAPSWAREQAGNEPEDGRHPSQPCVQPVTPASPQPAPHASTAARGPTQDPTQTVAGATTTAAAKGPRRGTRRQVPAPPLQRRRPRLWPGREGLACHSPPACCRRRRCRHRHRHPGVLTSLS